MEIENMNGNKTIWIAAGMIAMGASFGFGADKKDDALVTKGKQLFQTKICFTCHATLTNPNPPAGMALKAPKFIGKFWGTEREVHVGGPGGKIEKVKMDAAYFSESIKLPMAKIVKGSLPGMAPLPTTDDEIKALMAYVMSLSKEEAKKDEKKTVLKQKVKK